MGEERKMAVGEGEESPTDHSRQGDFGRGTRIATGAERPRNDMVFTRGAVGFFVVRRGGALPLPRAG